MRAVNGLNWLKNNLNWLETAENGLETDRNEYKLLEMAGPENGVFNTTFVCRVM